MKPKKLEWKPSINNPDYVFGILNGYINFEIRKVGKKVIRYHLFSYSLHAPEFPRANYIKKLDEFETFELAQTKADEIFEKFVNSLIEE